MAPNTIWQEYTRISVYHRNREVDDDGNITVNRVGVDRGSMGKDED